MIDKKWIVYLAIALLMAVLLLSACGQGQLVETLEEEGVLTAPSTEQTAEPSPTPLPTPTPGPLTELVSDVTAASGLHRVNLLGIPAEDLINLGISAILVLVGYVLISWLVGRVARRLARRTATQFDDEFVKAIGPHLRWLVFVLILQVGIDRLSFLGDSTRRISSNLFFVAYLVLGFAITWRLLDFAVAWFSQMITTEQDKEHFKPLLVLAQRAGQVFLFVIAANIVLGRLGINLTALATTLGIAGLAISLAAQDTLADMIAGVIVLVDRPYRVGDRIEIQGLDTWGDVVTIGARTTRIRTRDNRMVIVPNSTISKNQVVNYTFPDPRYRIQTEIGIAYGTDVEYARSVLVNAVRNISGVLPDKPVEALYIRMEEMAMIFRVRWWIESYVDTRRMFDTVHTALQAALDQSGIESPYPTQNIHLQVDPNPGHPDTITGSVLIPAAGNEPDTPQIPGSGTE